MRATLGEIVGPVHPPDAMYAWFSAKFPTDQFVVFAFDGAPTSVDDAVAAVLERARDIPYLQVRVREDRFRLRYPRWEQVPVRSEQVSVHELPTRTWTGCLDALSTLTDDHLDPQTAAWRLHVFTPVLDVPGASGHATVVVLQINHVLGDGTRVAGLAGALLGRTTLPEPLARVPAQPRIRGVLATLRARREVARATEAGDVPATRAPVSARSVNERPSGTRVLRTFVLPRARLPGPTLTIGAMLVISDALSDYLRSRGEDASQLTAAVPVARTGAAQGYNHFDLAWVGFHNDAPSRDEQVRRIMADLMAWRRRSQHPALAAKAAAASAIPAPLRRMAIRMVRTGGRPTMVPAHTTVSSVNRGAADLTFGGCPVLFTTSFPALVPISSLGHGVHSIGDTVAISVIASTPQVDVEDYLARLDAALTR